MEFFSSSTVAQVFLSFAVATISIAVLSPLTHVIGLVDKPCERKQHLGSVPLIGGLVIFSSTLIASLIFVAPTIELLYFLSAAGLVTITGALDDRFDINYRARLLIQFVAAGLLVFGAGDVLTSFGQILGPYSLNLGIMSIPVTIFAIAGLINAFNMVDGIDGLAGGLSLVAIFGIYLLTKNQISADSTTILALVAGALLGYLVFNLHIFPRITKKVFMGDAGSMFLGFVVTAFLIRYTQGPKQVFAPVTALWVVAVPLFDLLTTTIRRVRHGKSPFHPDRTHMHHIFIRAGFSSRATLAFLMSYAMALFFVGYLLRSMHESIQLIAVLFAFAGHNIIVAHAWKTAKVLKTLSPPRIKKLLFIKH